MYIQHIGGGILPVTYALFLGLILYCYPNIGVSQSIPSNYIANVQHFSTEQGLSHWNTNTVMQDEQGFIWVATEYGLNRFDGHRFQVFTEEKDGLAFNEIHHVLEDSEGWLWLMKCKNKKFLMEITDICFMHTRTFEVLSMEERFGKDFPLHSKSLHSVINHPSKTIFLSTEEGEVFQYKSKDLVSQLAIDLPGILRFHHCSEEGMLLGYVSEKRNVGKAVIIDTLGKVHWSGPDKYLRVLPQDENGTQWCWNRRAADEEIPIELFYLSEDHQLRAYPNSNIPQGKEFASYWRGRFSYRSIDDTYWYVSTNGFWVFHPERGLLFDFQKSHASIVENEISRLFFDNQDNAWLSTLNGVYKIQLKPSPFKKYLSSPPKTYTVKNAISTRGLLTHNGKLWVNTTKIARYLVDLKNGNAKTFPPLIGYGGKGQERNLIAHAIAQPSENVLLLGSNSLFRYDIEKEKYYTTHREETEMSPVIWAIHQDRYDNFWLGLDNHGLERWDRAKDSLISFKEYLDFPSFNQGQIYSFLEWDAEHLLIGSTTGIYVLHQRKGIIQRYWKGGKEAFYFPHNTIHHLHRDKEHPEIVWVATGGGGLVQWTLDEQLWRSVAGEEGQAQIKQFTILDGLSSNVIYAVYEDAGQNLWMSSDYGIIRFRKNDFSSEAFIEEDGISHHEFNRISHCQDEDGNLYFGGLNGITVFHPKQISDAPLTKKAPLRITNYQQFDGKESRMVDRTGELIVQKQIRLEPKDKLFNLEFALLEYQDADKARYSYRIEGQDKNWIYLDDNRLRISGLPFGRYTLKIRGQGANGQYSPEQLSIPIWVQAPYYLQAWFLIAVAILLAVFILLLSQWRTRFLRERQKALELEVAEATRTIQAQNKSLKQLDKMKSNFFANVSHELKTPLTLLLAPVQAVLKNQQLSHQDSANLKLAKTNGLRLNKLINEILDLTKLEAGKLTLHPTKILWYPFLRRVVANFESIANQKNIQYAFHYSGSDQLQVKLDKDKVEIILTNLLSNAFKYTPKNGTIHVTAESEGHFLELKVSDTGRGISPDDLPFVFDRFYQSKRKNAPVEGGTGIGLALTKELVVLMQGTIKGTSVLGEGSEFGVKIPLVEIISQLSTADAELLRQIKTETGQPTLPVATPSEALPAFAPDTKRPNILLVEDNLDLRNFLKTLLESKYRIHAVENGQAALDFLAAQECEAEEEAHPDFPHLIVSDVMMPFIDGFQLLRALKSDPRTSTVPVIMLTARSGVDDKLKALRIGVDDYMLKPFEERELFARIKNLLMHSRWRKEFQTEIDPELLAGLSEAEEKEEPAMVLNREDREWLESLEETIFDKIGDFNLSVENLAYDMATSRWQLNRRIKRLTGLTAKHYLTEIRLNRARTMLEQGECSTIKSLTYKIGVKDTRYFSRQFKKRFGKIPSEYL